jgi:plasmid maintenance system killer protein
MKLIAEGDLKELLTTGQNRKYRSIANNKILFNGLKRAVKYMMAAESVEDLKLASFLHYEKLKYSYSGYSSVRLSNSYVHRLIFEEKEDRITLKLIEIDETHYGNKK